MSKMSIWKRFGGWLGRSHKTAGAVDVVHVDAEGLLVNPENDEAMLTKPATATEQKLEVIEEGFNRMVDILGSIDETLSRQREQQEELQQRLGQLCEQGSQTVAVGTRMLEGFAGQKGTLEAIDRQLEQNDAKLEALLVNQQKRFTWLFVTAMAVSLAALGAVIYLVIR